MLTNDMINQAKKLREKFKKYELKTIGKTWTRDQIVSGFVGDVGDLVKLTMAKDGLRQKDNLDEKLEHELADCL